MTKESDKQLKEIQDNAVKAISELLKIRPLKKGSVFVIGCSSSEVAGGTIGKNSSSQIGKAIFDAAYKFLSKKGIYLACQCCEHLNRAIVVEEKCAEEYNLEPVCVVPWVHAGGSFATAAYYGLKNPCVVEHIKADAGLDIGDTLIGMHLKEVAVPVHLKQNLIGKAHVTAAYSRPKLIGGERAKYVPDCKNFQNSLLGKSK